MKPNTRVINYVSLIQDGVLTLDDVPQDVQKEVTRWSRYLSGVTDNGMVKDSTATITGENSKEEIKVPIPDTLITKKAGE